MATRFDWTRFTNRKLPCFAIDRKWATVPIIDDCQVGPAVGGRRSEASKVALTAAEAGKCSKQA